MSLPFVRELFGIDVTVHPMAVVCALIGAGGALLVATALGLFGGTRVDARFRRGLGSRVGLADESKRIEGIDATSAMPHTGSFAERVLAPLIQAALARTGENERAWVERAYDLLDRQRTGASDYYLKKVVCALAGFGFGVGLGVMTGGLVFMLALPLGLSLLGYWVPRLELQHDLQRRAERMAFEAPYLLDRLGVNLLARHGDLVDALYATLKPASNRAATGRTPGTSATGGYLARELLQVVADNAKAGHLDRALERMAERNRDVPLVARIAELLAHAQKGGVDLIPALQALGDRATEEVENRIRRRGEENSQAMLAPSVIALAGVMAVMLGPALMEITMLLR